MGWEKEIIEIVVIKWEDWIIGWASTESIL